MKLKILLILLIVCSSCASRKRLDDSHFTEIDYLLHTPDSISHYNVQYRNYFNCEEFVWDTLEVNVAEYNYKKLDSLLQELTLNPHSWEVSELSGIYEKFEQQFFDEYDSFIKAKKWTLGAKVDHSHVLDDAINLLRNIDYMIYAKKRYGRKGFKNGYKIFRKECALREEFRKREKYKDWRLATKDFDKIDYFTSNKYRDHVIEADLWPFCGKYTMLDKYIQKNTTFLLRESELLRNKPELVDSIAYSYVQELNRKIYTQNWGLLLDDIFDEYLLFGLMEAKINYGRYRVKNLFMRGNQEFISKFYRYDVSHVTPSNKYYPPIFSHYLYFLTNDSRKIVEDNIIGDLNNYCNLDSITQHNLRLLSKLDWYDLQIDSLIEVQTTNPCAKH